MNRHEIEEIVLDVLARIVLAYLIYLLLIKEFVQAVW